MTWLRRTVVMAVTVGVVLVAGCGRQTAPELFSEMQQAYGAANSLQWHGEITVRHTPAKEAAMPLTMVSDMALSRPNKIVCSSQLESGGQVGMSSSLHSDGGTAWLALSQGGQPVVFKAPAGDSPMTLLADEMVQVPELFEGSPIVSPVALFYGQVDVSGATLTLADESETIDGLECTGLTIAADQAWAEQRLWIGREDHLLHGIDFSIDGGDGQTVDITWRAANLQIDATFADTVFAFQPPEGAEVHEGETFKAAYDILRYGVGKPAKDFKLKTLDGQQTLTLADLKGKPAVIDFWATWCGPCKESQPALQKLHETYGDQVRFLMISDEDSETVTPVVQQRGLTITQLLDPDHQAATTFGVDSYPTTIYLDAQGIVTSAHAGFDPRRDVYEQFLEPLKPLLTQE